MKTHSWNVVRCSAYALILFGLSMHCQSMAAGEVDGFTEPNRTVDVASSETGILTEMSVNVGDFVQVGAPLGRLNDEVFRILTQIADQKMKARGRLDAANAEVALRTDRVTKLQTLRGEGYGRSEEVDRAAADLKIAQAELKSILEDVAQYELEYQKAKSDWDRRTIKSPLSGYVAQRLKQVGEFVSQADPIVATIVETDPILARFSLKPSVVSNMKVGQKITVSLSQMKQKVEGTIVEISPIMDAQSGTLRVKISLKNPENRIISGQVCTLDTSVLGEPETRIGDASQGLPHRRGF
jgi:RND family efflux transporter MFP subunit